MRQKLKPNPCRMQRSIGLAKNGTLKKRTQPYWKLHGKKVGRKNSSASRTSHTAHSTKNCVYKFCFIILICDWCVRFGSFGFFGFAHFVRLVFILFYLIFFFCCFLLWFIIYIFHIFCALIRFYIPHCCVLLLMIAYHAAVHCFHSFSGFAKRTKNEFEVGNRQQHACSK